METSVGGRYLAPARPQKTILLNVTALQSRDALIKCFKRNTEKAPLPDLFCVPQCPWCGTRREQGIGYAGLQQGIELGTEFFFFKCSLCDAQRTQLNIYFSFFILFPHQELCTSKGLFPFLFACQFLQLFYKTPIVHFIADNDEVIFLKESCCFLFFDI